MELRFGNLEDIISAKKAEVQALQSELNKLLEEECENLEKCELRSQGIPCDQCFLKDECRDDSKKNFAKADLLEEEMGRILKKVKYLLIELFLSQHKDAHIEYLDLELFPRTNKSPS